MACSSTAASGDLGKVPLETKVELRVIIVPLPAHTPHTARIARACHMSIDAMIGGNIYLPTRRDETRRDETRRDETR